MLDDHNLRRRVVSVARTRFYPAKKGDDFETPRQVPEARATESILRRNAHPSKQVAESRIVANWVPHGLVFIKDADCAGC